jgi:hypothetical protein
VPLLLKDIGEFTWAVLTIWQAYMTGSIVTALVGLYERLSQKTVSTRAYIAGVIAFLLVAFFMAWRENHLALIKLQQKLKTPEFSGEISALGSGVRSDGAVAVVVSGRIINPHGPPSGIAEWKVQIDLPGRWLVDGTIPFPSAEDIHLPLAKSGGSAVLKTELYWPGEAIKPIPEGGASDGWLIAILPKEIQQKELYGSGTTCILSFKDIANVSWHYLKRSFSDKPVSNLPGVGELR